MLLIVLRLQVLKGIWIAISLKRKNVKWCITAKTVLDTSRLPYSMCGQQLEEVTSEKDLGVVFSKDLKVRIQCEKAYNKASQMLGLIHRIIRFKDPSVLIALYKSMVTPHLENCSVV